MNTPALHLGFLAPVPPRCGRFVGNPEVEISLTSRNSTASSGDAILGCVFGVSRREADPYCPKTPFTDEELQVKFLLDSDENPLSD
jgi:hypothetical protein